MKKIKILINILILLISGFFLSEYEKNNLKIVGYKISSKKIKNNKRFIFLSDLHDKEFGYKNKILLEKIDELKPDAIFIGGDFTCTKKKVDISKTLFICRKLVDKYPVYYGNGNHELRMKKKKYKGIYYKFVDKLTQMGVIYLSNKKERVVDNINIYGLDIDDIFYKKFYIPKMNKRYIELSLGNIDKKDYNILLAHSPNFFEAYSTWGSDLTLCGHFHGGTIRLTDEIGLMTPQLQFFNRNVSSLKSKGDSKMIVSAGLGTHSINIRINNRPELIYIDMESNCQDVNII